MKSEAQTALNYLLILLVIITIIAIIVVWLQFTSTYATGTNQKQIESKVCGLQTCANKADCDGVGNCPSGTICGSSGTCQE